MNDNNSQQLKTTEEFILVLNFFFLNGKKRKGKLRELQRNKAIITHNSSK